MRPQALVTVLALFLAAASGPACSEDEGGGGASPATIVFDPDAELDAEGAFFDFPYPSDLRLTSEGTPDLASFPDPGVPILAGLKVGATQRKGFPVVPVGYFKLTAQPAPRDPEVVVEGGARAALLLLDVDPASPSRGATVPVVAHTPNADPYVPEHLLAIAARPGVILAPSRRYAFVVTRAVGLESGGEPVAPAALAALARGETPEGASGAAMRDLYAPLWETLDSIGVARGDVVGATVFTTGDVVTDTHALSQKVLAAHTADVAGYELEAETSGEGAPFCHVRATITLPQFQRGVAPFDTEGLFDVGADGAPVKQRDETVGVSLALPKEPMPAGGYPLVVYFHGSGGVSREVIDGGEKAEPTDRWPAAVLAKHRFAVAGAALPISPERVPGAGAFDYVNINNMVATRDTFRQGVVESRLFISALERARIPASVVEACSGPTLPAGEDAFRFAPAPHAQGQSMGGMYTNLVSATDERIKLAVPTGAGGYWSYFILRTNTIPGVAGLLSLVLKTTETLTFLHPAVHVAETALEPIDPMVSVPRIGHDPLPGHPARSLYVPAGKDDSYFPEAVFDAMAVAYRHPRAGDVVWSTMDQALSLVGVDGPLGYPVKANMTSANGAPFTSAVVQYETPGHDGHQIYRRLDAVMHQYGCFHETFRATGTAVLPAPAAFDAPCAE
ncbi:MAG: hypothetical protein KF894_17225 [Labilithrix sp.]|nr:hypothetical protein [Labilithrix sp.]